MMHMSVQTRETAARRIDRSKWLWLAMAVVSGCSDPSPAAPSADSGADAGVIAADGGATDAGLTQPVRLNFQAVVGAEPFTCGTVFHGLGTTHTDWNPSDFRFYVHDVRLVSSTGVEVPVTLDEDSVWQHEGVGLLDFENGTGGCAAGTSPTNDHLTGRVPVGTYTGLRFRVGVPFAMNHVDSSVAPSPLNIGGMFWSWATGYKFVKIDGRSTGVPTGYNVHVGSTGCTASASGQIMTPCTNPNIASVDLPAFDPERQAVVADLAALLAGSNLDANTMGTAPGCMSAPMDPECTAIFSRMGLTYDGVAPTGAQSFFTVR